MKMLACIDLSPVSEALLQMAAGRKGEVHLLYVVSGDVLIRKYDPAHVYVERERLGHVAFLA